MLISSNVLEGTARRYAARLRNRRRARRLMREHRYLEVDDPERVAKFLARNGFSRRDAEALLREGKPMGAVSRDVVDGRDEPYAAERVLGISDLMGVAFLERGLQVSRSVGRVWVDVRSGSPSAFGTGFLVSPRLLLTNHHVLESASSAASSLVEFNYEVAVGGALRPSAVFRCRPDEFFETDSALDYALVALERRNQRGEVLEAQGWNTLIEAEGKAIATQFVNIIQHPNGEPKQLALRENQILDVLESYLHYRTDTAPGSSGSPVYNDRWEVVALHHSGVPRKNAAGQTLAIGGRVWRRDMGEHRVDWIANEGVRISRIVADLRRRPLGPERRALLAQATSLESAQAPAPPYDRDAQPVAPVSSCTQDDGTAVWTIPISVAIRVGAGALGGPDTKGATAQAGAAISAPVVGRSSDEDSLLDAARREFGERADVLGVRMGWKFRDGWITRERALVVTVDERKPRRALAESGTPALPATFEGYPVDVTGPTIEELVRHAAPSAATEALGDTPDVEEITYKPPAGVPLKKVTAVMRVIAHVSPDQGWTQLKKFLGATKKTLTVGMYDFGAPHIVKAIADRAPGMTGMTLVMQAGESVGGDGTKKDDLRDAEAVAALKKKLGSRLKNAWVKLGPAKGWVAFSYHIKVAVKDGGSFWLSSGNWQSSNQPSGARPAKPLDWLHKFNREWHAIVQHGPLAKTFEKYLQNDFENNKDTGADEALDLPDVFVRRAATARATEAAPKAKFFQPFDKQRKFTVTPLLTPDNFQGEVLKLVKSAKHTLDLQNQTFNAPKAQDTQLRELVTAVLDRAKAGVKVRIVFRKFMPADTRKNIEALVDMGFDPDTIKVQEDCHTKGIVVDGKSVLIGSHNWSNTGVSVNRDASLLFHDAPLAAYFADVFEHDWKVLAEQDIGSEDESVRVAGPGERTPSGHARVTWKEYMEMR